MNPPKNDNIENEGNYTENKHYFENNDQINNDEIYSNQQDVISNLNLNKIQEENENPQEINEEINNHNPIQENIGQNNKNENDNTNNNIQDNLDIEHINEIKNVSNMEGEELMDEINKNAELINPEINPNELFRTKLYSFTEEELRVTLNEKNQTVAQLFDEKEQAKTELNSLIIKLNTLISENANILYHREPDPEILKKLENTVTVRQSELNQAKQANEYYKENFNIISKKAKDKFSSKKLREIEKKIEQLKHENISLVKQIRELKGKSTIKAKELETCTTNKKFPHQVIACTQEIKTLNNKKHDYHEKLSKNMKSLDNTLRELEVLQKMYDANIDEQCDQNVVNKLNDWMSIIKEDLNGTKEEILKKIFENNSKFLKIINENMNKKINNQKLHESEIVLPLLKGSLPINNEKLKSNSPTHNPSPKGNKHHKSSSVTISKNQQKGYQGVFSKYSYLQKLTIKPVSTKKQKYIVKSSEDNEELTSEDLKKLLLTDYDSATENDFKSLIDKKEQYIKMNERFDKSVKDFEKQSERKLNEVGNTIKENKDKLEQLIKANDLMKKEIENLHQVFDLTKEQNKLKKLVKDNEDKFAKSVVIAQQQPKPYSSQENNLKPIITDNEILQEVQLNENILVEETNQTRQDSARNIKCKFNLLIIIYNIKLYSPGYIKCRKRRRRNINR